MGAGAGLAGGGEVAGFAWGKGGVAGDAFGDGAGLGGAGFAGASGVLGWAGFCAGTSGAGAGGLTGAEPFEGVGPENRSEMSVFNTGLRSGFGEVPAGSAGFAWTGTIGLCGSVESGFCGSAWLGVGRVSWPVPGCGFRSCGVLEGFLCRRFAMVVVVVILRLRTG